MDLSRQCRRQRGFSLIETLIALAILGTALLLGAALLLQHPRVLRRLDAQREAYRAIESTLEAVRAGALPLQSLELDGFVTSTGKQASEDLKLSMVVRPGDLPGLYHVTLVARYPDPYAPRPQGSEVGDIPDSTGGVPDEDDDDSMSGTGGEGSPRMHTKRVETLVWEQPLELGR
jgi:prepilin-type N-terminal cleavage/methylation domain-containing protein